MGKTYRREKTYWDDDTNGSKRHGKKRRSRKLDPVQENRRKKTELKDELLESTPNS